MKVEKIIIEILIGINTLKFKGNKLNPQKRSNRLYGLDLIHSIIQKCLYNFLLKMLCYEISWNFIKKFLINE